MTSKKEKRQRGIRRHHEFMEKYRRDGLEALEKEREHRRRQNLRAWQDQHDKKHTSTRIVECPHCQHEMQAAQKSSEAQPVS